MFYRDVDAGHGLAVAVEKDGIVGFDIRADRELSPTLGSGTDMMIGAMDRLRREGVDVKKLRGYWLRNSDSVNAKVYWELRAKGLSPEDAARQTWTGHLAKEFGYPRVESVREETGVVQVIFGKPQ